MRRLTPCKPRCARIQPIAHDARDWQRGARPASIRARWLDGYTVTAIAHPRRNPTQLQSRAPRAKADDDGHWNIDHHKNAITTIATQICCAARQKAQQRGAGPKFGVWRARDQSQSPAALNHLRSCLEYAPSAPALQQRALFCGAGRAAPEIRKRVAQSLRGGAPPAAMFGPARARAR